MPKSRRARLTPKKTRKVAPNAMGLEKNAPTEEKWAKMPSYETFQVEDDDHITYDFSKNQTARILPNKCRAGADIELHEFWVCEIIDIRAEKETEVWVKVHWFYSAQDARKENPTFDASHCGLYERIKSEHVDCVSSSAFDGHASVSYYDENALDPEAISGDDFYYRYTIDVTDKSISPEPSATCTCTRPYNPSDTNPESLMHFCSRPQCRKWYHSGCIGSKRAPPAAERDRGFLLCDPRTGDPLELDNLMDSASEPPKKKQKRRSSQAKATKPVPVVGAAASTFFAALPPALLDAAAQPIVKGAAFPAGGVTGNIAAVLAARQLVFDALRDGASADGWEAQMPDQWAELVNVKLLQDYHKKVKPRRGSIGKLKGGEVDVLALQCPECGGPI
ncbi:hypothetical protein B0H11DRAFT_2291420 [Mycena galericulata]|nr:hypothetical protein B0H11DRAFT_2291420 [Mycena galericulata]